MMLAAVGLSDPTRSAAHGERIGAPSQFEGTLWRLVNERPMHMLASAYTDWRQFLLVQLDTTLDDLARTCSDLPRCTWGSRDPVRIQHPLSHSLPFLSRFLDMP